MTIFESIIVALESIAANRLRSGLTMLGIIFGVGAVISAVSLTEGARRATLERFERMGTNTLTVRPGQNSRGPVSGGVGSQNTLTLDDAAALLAEIPEIENIAPQVNGRAQVDGGGTNTNTTIVGTTASVMQVSSYDMADGSFFTDDDVERNRKVAVLGATVTKNLFGDGASVAGRRIKIAGTTFRVCGQYASKGAMGFRDPDDQILIPITTAVRRVLG